MFDCPSNLANVLAQEIKSRFPDGITSGEMAPYEKKYLNALGPNPGNNWLSKMAWARIHAEYLRQALAQEKVSIRPDTQTAPHDHDLHETGYQRLC